MVWDMRPIHSRCLWSPIMYALSEFFAQTARVINGKSWSRRCFNLNRAEYASGGFNKLRSLLSCDVSGVKIFPRLNDAKN